MVLEIDVVSLAILVSTFPRAKLCFSAKRDCIALREPLWSPHPVAALVPAPSLEGESNCPMPKTVAIVQSNYIPWKGYFDLIRQADEFILYDDAQYTRRDWRNRNRIKTPGGVQWLTIPVDVKGKYHQKIKDTKVSTANWGLAHWQRLCQNYSRAPYFRFHRDRLEHLYRTTTATFLSDINHAFLQCICESLGIRTCLTIAGDVPPSGRHPLLIRADRAHIPRRVGILPGGRPGSIHRLWRLRGIPAALSAVRSFRLDLGFAVYGRTELIGLLEASAPCGLAL